MMMPGRTFSGGGEYRYGFNGKELDKEVASTSTYDYGFRIYSPGLGKFLSVDPLSKEYPWNSPYSYAENDVIRSIDIDGLERWIVINYVNRCNQLYKTEIHLVFDKNIGETIDMEFKLANGVKVTTNQVLELRFDNATDSYTEIARPPSVVNSLTPAELRVAKTAISLPDFDNGEGGDNLPFENTAQITDMPVGAGVTANSASMDGATTSYRVATANIPPPNIIVNRQVNQQLTPTAGTPLSADFVSGTVTNTGSTSGTPNTMNTASATATLSGILQTDIATYRRNNPRAIRVNAAVTLTLASNSMMATWRRVANQIRRNTGATVNILVNPNIQRITTGANATANNGSGTFVNMRSTIRGIATTTQRVTVPQICINP